MLGLEVIKQTIENNSSKPAINPNIVRKLALSRINSDMRFSNDWIIREELNRIINSNLPDEVKGELIECLKNECYQAYENTKKNLNEIFGSTEEKQASVKSDEDSGTKGEKEEIAKSSEGNADEEAEDDKKDEHKTPAEHVIEQKPGQSMFQY